MNPIARVLRRIRRERLSPSFWIVWGAVLVLLRQGPRAAAVQLREGLQQRARWRPIRLGDPGPPLRFETASAPRVSIVIPVCDRWRYTYNCLRSIVACDDRASYEVVVVDNASSDGTTQELASFESLVLLRQETNRGYVEGCNLGVAAARGELILLLNNDTEVTSGWLDRLVSVLDEDEAVGVVGPKLLFPNGRLQEAGNFVHRDGSAENRGKFDDPWKAEYESRAEVDYVSGAALLLRRSLFDEIGGLDERYSPGFWEDVDLCFAVRERGLRVLCEPAAVVYHFEGTSSWRHPEGDGGWRPESNARLFRERWAERLNRQRERPLE